MLLGSCTYTQIVPFPALIKAPKDPHKAATAFRMHMTSCKRAAGQVRVHDSWHWASQHKKASGSMYVGDCTNRRNYIKHGCTELDFLKDEAPDTLQWKAAHRCWPFGAGFSGPGRRHEVLGQVPFDAE